MATQQDSGNSLVAGARWSRPLDLPSTDLSRTGEQRGRLHRCGTAQRHDPDTQLGCCGQALV